MSVSTDQIKKLRDMTGAGVLDAKRTLEEYKGDFDKALAILKEKAAHSAEKKTDRAAKQGVIEAYLHSDKLSAGGKIGVLVELNCETDFVARTPEFKELARNIALHITAAKPTFVSADDIPAATLEDQRKMFADAARAEGKPENIVEKIVQGKIESYIRDSCLLKQPFIRDETMTVQDLLQAAVAKLRENIVVRRFARFELGE
jgi:elongation factor Ts